MRDIFLNPDVQEAYNRELRVGMLQGAPLGGGCAGLLRHGSTEKPLSSGAVSMGLDGWLRSVDSLVMPGQVEERITRQHRLWNGHADYFT